MVQDRLENVTKSDGLPELRVRLSELERQNEALRRDLAEVERLACDDCKLQQLLLEEYALQHAHEALYLIEANRALSTSTRRPAAPWDTAGRSCSA